MFIQNRLLRIVYTKERNILIASDVKGRVHKFDLELNLLQSSPVISYTCPINAICLSNNYIFTKDRMGSIGKWDLDTLMPLDFYHGDKICNLKHLYKDEEISPSPNRGIAVLNGRLYTNNGFNQIVVLDIKTFEIIDIRQSPSPAFFDCICVDNKDIHALSDTEGKLFIGNLETNEFPVTVQVDLSVVHGVVYDYRHDRFWTTQDAGLGDDKFLKTGVTIIEKNGTQFKEYKISHEDNEFIQFDPDCRYLFVGGFNGKIFVFDNENTDFQLRRVIGPLNFQIIHAAIVSKNQIYALLQTGELILLDEYGKEIKHANYQNKCVWILEAHPKDDSLLYAGTDDGVSLIRYKSAKFDNVHIEQLVKHVHGFGIIKDVKPLPDGSYIAISRNGYVFNANSKGVLRWYYQVLGIPRGCAVNADYDYCMVATDQGSVWEFSIDNGRVIDKISVGSPSYACAYSADGRRIVTADKNQMIHVYATKSHNILGSIKFSYRLKRLIYNRSQGKIFVTGADGMFELDLENYVQKKEFGQYMTSTKENGIYCRGYVYVGGYGYQIASYNYENSELIDLEEYLPDYTKAFAARLGEDNVPILLVGGRGGFINVYKIYEGIPHKVREFYIQ